MLHAPASENKNDKVSGKSRGVAEPEREASPRKSAPEQFAASAVNDATSGGDGPTSRRQKLSTLQGALGNQAVLRLLDRHSVDEALRPPGQPLDARAREFFEPHIKHDFSRVRLHTDATAAKSARSLKARAYTLGQRIVFGANEYQPDTVKGRRLLAHELAHAAQQPTRGDALEGAAALEASEPGDGFEREANRVAASITSGNKKGQHALASVSRSSLRIAREGEGTTNAAEAKAGVEPSTVLPFKGQQPGEEGWDSDAILKNSKIDAGSEAGKAISAGTKKVEEMSLQMAMQTADEMKSAMGGDEYWGALMKASLTCSLFAVSVTLLSATYADLDNFAAITDVLAKNGDEKKKGLVAWSNRPDAAPSTAAPKADAPAGGPAATNAVPTPGTWAPAYGATPKTHTGKTVEEYQKLMGTGDFSQGQGIELLKAASAYGGPKRKTMKITDDQLYYIFPDLKKDVDADASGKTKEKANNYLKRLNEAFQVMMIDTVPAQAVYLAHSYVESDQFRKFNETTQERYNDDPKKAKLDESYLQTTYMEPSEKALKKDPNAKNPFRTTVNPVKADDPSAGWDQSFIGRGPLQVTHRAIYVQVIAFLDKRVQQATADKDDETAKIALEAENALKADPRNAADPKYAFLVSAAFMQMAGGVRRTSLLGKKPGFEGEGPESIWMTGKNLEQTEPIDKPTLKADAYKRAVKVLTEADAEEQKNAEQKKPEPPAAQ
ncbi:MAG: hypothetical protein QOE33_3459 [Acidobacteriota bacterium]|nr:hypothetical protein [Acidobacteriota bacterium]